MFRFGKTSLDRLGTCDTDLQRLAMAAIETSPYDFSIAVGHRGKEEQDRCVAQHLSKTPWPNSKHNSTPSRAFDFVPFVDGKQDWENVQAFKDVAHHILMTADQMGLKVRWGGTWSSDPDAQIAKFCDMPHIELCD